MVKHIRNLDRWNKVVDGEVLFTGAQARGGEIIVNSVGPCVVHYVPLGPDGKPSGDEVLLGCSEGLETYRWDSRGPCMIVLEPSGEVWVYRDQTPLAKPAENGVSMTRVEKAGLYMDDLGMALHRQAVLQRMARMQATEEDTRYTRGLEERLEALSALVATLRPPQPDFEPEPQPEPEPEK